MSILRIWYYITNLSCSWFNLPGLLITIITGVLLLLLLLFLLLLFLLLLLHIVMVRSSLLEQVKVGGCGGGLGGLHAYWVQLK